MNPPPQPPPQRPKGKLDLWWDRNWKWFVPVLAVGGSALFCGFFMLVLSSVLTLMKSSGAYVGAMARTEASAAVVAALGKPIKAGYFVTGNINVNGSSGKAELVIPIRGPKGAAATYVEATETLGAWHFDRLVVQLEQTGGRIDLSDGPYLPIRSRDLEPAAAPVGAAQTSP
jgi:hypothetical protein